MSLLCQNAPFLKKLPQTACPRTFLFNVLQIYNTGNFLKVIQLPYYR